MQNEFREYRKRPVLQGGESLVSLVTLNLGCGNSDYGDVRVDLKKTNTTTHIFDAGEKFPLEDNSFEQVYERNLLEHLPNPGFHLREVRRVLKPNGTLIVITDNAACLKFYTLGTHTGGYRKNNGKDIHYAVFTMEHMKNLMEYAGLLLVDIRLIDTGYFTKHYDKIVRLFKPSLSYPRISVRASKA